MSQKSHKHIWIPSVDKTGAQCKICGESKPADPNLHTRIDTLETAVKDLQDSIGELSNVTGLNVRVK